MHIKQYLNQPYPFFLNTWKVIVTISFFVALFLVAFKPFGLDALESEYKILLISGYGIVTFIVLVIDLVLLPLLFPTNFSPERWTIKKQYILYLWIILSISTTNYFYSVLFNIFPWYGIGGLLIYIVFTALIAFFPITGVMVISQNRLLKKNITAANKMNEKLLKRDSINQANNYTVEIYVENKNEKVRLLVKDFIYAQSEGNYVNIYFYKDETVSKGLLRGTLKNLESQVTEYDELFKCHRAFLVNCSKINSVDGNSQGYRLKLSDVNELIPVSRSYAKELFNLLD